MNVPLLVAGILLLALAFIDAFWTALWVDRSAGPLSARLTSWIWRGGVRVLSRKRQNLLSLFGPGLVLIVLLTWVLLVWAGWTLVFSASEDALLSSRGPGTPDLSGRIYFVAYSMFTMGNGDFYPNGSGWQIATALTTASGMILITVAVTYLLSVVGAVVTKRSFASQVAGLGGTPAEILRGAWNGRDFRTLDLPLNSIAGEIALLGQQFLAYPILHYYHPTDPDRSPAMAIARLDEAVTLLRFGVAEDARPNPAVLRSAIAGIGSYLRTLERATIEPAPEPPPAPDLQPLREMGVPLVEAERFEREMEGLRDRRRKVLALVRNDGWRWSDLSLSEPPG